MDVDALLGLLSELVAVPSLGGEEREAQERVARQMREWGLATDVWDLDLPALKRHPDCSMEVERSEGLGVAGTWGEGQGGRTLVLNGHVDVVPAGEATNWTTPPWEAVVRGGHVFGRGTVDMKGGLACGLAAAKALVDSGVRINGKLILESVIGEEDGGVGTLAAAIRGYRGDGAVIMEPTELKIGSAQAGALSFRVRIEGLSAHACVREEGVSAIEKFLPVHDALLRLETRRNRRDRNPLFARYKLPYALSIGTLRSGSWPSSVAESLVFEGRYGLAIGESPATARAELERAVAVEAKRDPWLRKHRPRVEWWGGQFESAEVPRTHPLPTMLAAAARAVRGTASPFEGMTYGSDMRLMVKVAETPTVLFGPGDVRDSHRPDESVSVAELEACAKSLALLALRFCGGT